MTLNPDDFWTPERNEKLRQRFSQEMTHRGAATMLTDPSTIDVKAEAQKWADAIDAALAAVIYEDVSKELA